MGWCGGKGRTKHTYQISGCLAWILIAISMKVPGIPGRAAGEAIGEVLPNPVYPTLVDWLSFATLQAYIADRSGMTNPGTHCYKCSVTQEKREMGGFPVADSAGQMLIYVACVHGSISWRRSAGSSASST